MVRIASFRAFLGIVHSIIPLAAAGMVLLMAAPVAAQPFGEQDRFSQRETQVQERPSNSPTNLPDWAEPSSPEYGDKGEAPKKGGGVQTKDTPALPGDPEQVPVDGGLSLLAAVGAGYAIRKLGESEDDEGDGELP